MTTPLETENERIRKKYPRARQRELVVAVGVIAATGVASLFRHVAWWYLVGAIVGFAVWELTKLRLRRNAREYARTKRPD